MNTLRIQQGSNLVEQVTPLIINKLYEVALSVSEPLEGELDNAYLSGNLLVGRASQNKVKYLAGTVLVRGAGNEHNNSTGRFDDLKINVTDEYYIDFEDSEVEKVLLNNSISSDGAGVTISDAANATFTNPSPFYQNTDITSFDEFNYFTKANTNPPKGVGGGGGLFRECTNLKSINLSLCTTMGGFQFCACGIETVNAPLLTTFNGEELFNGSGVKTVVNLGSITTIPFRMFYTCKSLQSVTLPTTVTTIGLDGFSMYNLYNPTEVFTTITGLDNVTYYGARCFLGRNNLAINTSDIIKAQTIKNDAFNGCSSLTGELYLPYLTTLEQSAFTRCTGITKVTCIGKVSSIETNTFYKQTANSTLTEVYLPYECTSIGKNAFTRNTGLTTLKQYEHSVDNWVEGEIPTSTSVISRVTSFGLECFNECSNLTATIDLTNVTEIGKNAFRNTKILVTGTPSLYINIGPGAFVNCSNLTSFDFSNITTLKGSEFYESGLSGTLSIPNLTGVLNGGEFYNCTGLTSITNLGSITSITDNPPVVAYMAIGSFRGCTGLTSVTIPSTVTKIGASAFEGCSSLSQVNCSWLNIIEIGNGAFLWHADWDFIVNLQNLTTVGKGTLGGGSTNSKKIRQLYIPKIINTDSNTYYTNSTYYNGTFIGITADIIYLRDLQSLHPGDFTNTICTALVINNTTPPVWKNKNDLTDEETTNSSHTKDKVFGGSTITNIYVPDSAVTTYQTDANWSSVANKIQPLSNLTKVATEADLLANQVALIEAYM